MSEGWSNMDRTALHVPGGIDASMGWDPALTPHDRIRVLARRLVAQRMGVDEAAVRVDREAPAQFGYHTQLIATIDEREAPLLIKTASHRAASVVAVGEPGVRIGLDLRDPYPDDGTMNEIRRHSRFVADQSDAALREHWTRVQAILQADQRGKRVHPEYVRVIGDKGWISDRKEVYHLVDLSHDGFVVTLAYGAIVA